MRKAMVRSKDGLVLKITFETDELEEMVKQAVEEFKANLCGDCPYREDKDE